MALTLFIFLVQSLLSGALLSIPTHFSDYGNVRATIENLLTKNHSNYDSRIRPGTHLDQPLVVLLEVFINDISTINALEMSYDVDLYLRQLWTDERLAFRGEGRYKPVTLDNKQFDRIWTPDLFIRNEKQAHLHVVTVPNRLIRLHPNGTILYSQRLSLVLSCRMDLRRYPMDNQTCYINLGSYGYVEDDLIFRWNINNSDVVHINEDIELPEFSLCGNSIGNCHKSYTSTGNFSCVFLKLCFQRRFEFYALQTYIPSLLIVVISWVSFWIDLDSAPARISLGLLTVLTATTQSVSMTERLPRVAYIKSIDVWMAVCLIFVFGALLEYSLVNLLARTKRRKEGLITESLRLGDSTSSKEEIKNKLYGRRESKAWSPRKASEKKMCSCFQLTPYGRNLWRDKAMRVDIVSRFVFPALFGIFNVVYWSIYSVPGPMFN